MMHTIRALSLLLFCLLLARPSYGSEIDSLQQQIPKLGGKAKVATLNRLAFLLITEKDLPEDAKAYASEALELAGKLGDTGGQILAHENRALIFIAYDDDANALDYLLRGIELCDKAGDKAAKARLYDRVGALQLRKQNTEKAIASLESALELAQNLDDMALLGSIFGHLGDAYLGQEMFGRAEHYYQQAQEALLSVGRYAEAANIAGLLGDYYFGISDFEGAAVKYGQSLELHLQNGQQEAAARDYIRIGRAELSQDFFEDAQYSFSAAYDLVSADSGSLQLPLALAWMAETYLRYGDRASARQMYDDALAAAKRVPYSPESLDVYALASQAFETMGDAPRALSIYKHFASARDSLAAQEKALSLLDMQMRYESQFETEDLRRRNEMLRQEQAQNRIVRVFLIALVLLIGSLLALAVRSYRMKKQDNLLLQAKNQEIERQNAEIQDKNAILDELNQKLVHEMAERESMEQSSLARDRFLATMSHQMRTPMNIISGLTHLLLSEEPRTDQVEHLRTLQFSANNLIVFINDVLDFSKIEAGKLSIEESAFRPQQIFEEVKERFMLPAKDKSIGISLHYDEKIPQQLMGDPARLNQVITNLISTSLRHTERGHIDIDVRLHELVQDDVQLHIRVKDSSEGVAKDYLNQMLDNFARSAADFYENYGSTGLGLAIAKRLAELQNGHLEAQVMDGEGMVFKVLLPFRLVASDADAYDDKVAENNAELLRHKRVLLVEDNKINQLVVAKMLEKLGMAVTTADNGQEALDALRDDYFDVILMDIQMPVMDGYRATAEIRRMADPRHRDVPIIALTASAFLTEKEKARLFGMNDHVGKPFSPEELLHKLSQCLRREA